MDDLLIDWVASCLGCGGWRDRGMDRCLDD